MPDNEAAGKAVRITVTVSAATHQRLYHYGADNRIIVAKAIRRLLEEGLAAHDLRKAAVSLPELAEGPSSEHAE